MTDLAPIEQREIALVDPRSGEIVDPADVERAVDVLAYARSQRDLLMQFVKAAEAMIVAESTRQGTKTLRIGDYEAVVSGGSEIEWDIEELRARLLAAGCPDDRVTALIRETVTYKVDARVAKQLAAANTVYARIIESCRTVREKPPGVSVK